MAAVGHLAEAGSNGDYSGRRCCAQLLLSAWALRLRMDSRQGQLPAGTAERLAPRRKPELGAALRTDVLAYPALLFQPPQRLVYKGVPGVEPVGYLVLYLPGPDGAVLLLDVHLDGVPDLCRMRYGGSSQTEAARIRWPSSV